MNTPAAPFGPATQAWFDAAFAAPTPAQAGAWKAVSAGDHALVVAPTGSGKTLAAFLWALDRLAHEPLPEDPTRRCRVLYVSPLKALAVDVERNLRTPLTGIRHAAARLGLKEPDITVGMRTGDTPADERRTFNRRPPDILITTPESLFLLLTSQARESLRGVETVIVDEVHAVTGTKRGAHLALSLERLDALLAQPAQRIGLSATVEPVEAAAQFLGGAAPVHVVQPKSAKTIEVSVEVPVEDMTALDEGRPDDEGPRRASIWPAVEERVFELIGQHRSTIVFTNSRRGAERLCARLNELAAEHLVTAVPPPAQIMAQSGAGYGAPPQIARAHHGSVSKEERKQIEEELKSGRLPAVVATSSLELGIDMGAVDLVVQVGAPPSVAAGLQRVGRAGHQVGAVSRGVVFPTHRGDLLSCAVVAGRMTAGRLEPLAYPHSPLDVLAQHIVAMTALDEWTVAELAALVRRAAPFAALPESALHAVLDMLAGRYPSTAFAELRPRIVWDRAADRLTGRPGNQRLAVTSGGTIPDRGLFGVFLAGSEKASRVGELDEEMVYESRVGDVFALGTSSWRIEDITPDRVLVSPAPGQPARLPFWKGDQAGRPVALGKALGAFLRNPTGMDSLDPSAVGNLTAYLEEQRAATRHLPDDRTVLVERFRDELGDWRIVLHNVLGAPVNAPWALAIGQRLRERYGVDAQVHAADDGIVIRLPETAEEPPGADLFAFDADEIEPLVAETVGGSALFASRFRECAARSLLLPRRDPGRRQPLWQQRQRAAQLLDVAREYPDFPVTLEAARECLRDVFDLPSLATMMRDIASRKIRMVEVSTPQPSPFARSLLFGYVGAFLYGEDAPLAERRAAALALDPTLLGELLGRVELRELLDPAVIEATALRLRWVDRRVRDAEDTVEMLRQLGDLSPEELTERGVAPGWLDELARTGRILGVRVAGQERFIIAEDAGRYRDALGVALPPGLPAAYTAAVADPLLDLLGRYARTHGPFRADDCAIRFGLGVAVVEHTLRRLSASGRLVQGEFTASSDGGFVEWCDAEVLRTLRRRSLAALRKEIEPVPPEVLGRFLPAWQHIGRRSEGIDAVAAAIDQIQGVPVPASALERLVLPARVADYRPSYLDELCATGEVVWAGAGPIGGNDGWIVLAFADAAPLLLPPPTELALTGVHEALLSALGGGALFFRQLADQIAAEHDELLSALWDLVWAGLVGNDTLAPVRARLSGGGAHRAKPTPGRARYRRPSLTGGRSPAAARGPAHLPAAAGRWHALGERDTDPTARAAALADALLERYGVVIRGAVAAENQPGGFAAVYPVLAALEDRGAARRGYFVEGLGAAQFALPGAVDRLRSYADTRDGAPRALVLAATDPANPYGAALPWPHNTEGHRPGRKAGALVVLVSGALALYVERGGRTLLSFSDDEAVMAAAAASLTEAVTSGALGPLTVERADGESVTGSPLGAALEAAGFRITPRGLRLRG
ncbi:ATP-dependent helicase [Catellatospora chokoriensis]|uniref:DEAD/DEAH box helicase n=1 Tax=Catellatospora chokoriensis TaxID=310353 RepID=A0A8J3NTB1_9ACTN|nr:ATP-dependent helicase [Catellatospora chokoriensis]GIF91483.1 DEAD/DEAH box helicase [Catellatospora chokoriensis]